MVLDGAGTERTATTPLLDRLLLFRSFCASPSSRYVDMPIAVLGDLSASSSALFIGSLALSASGVAPAWPASPETVDEA